VESRKEGTAIVEGNGNNDASGELSAQRKFMQGFAARGLENPEKTVTRKGFRELLVKGLVEDDLPYSLGEKSGMGKLFTYLLPYGFSIPSHHTVRRDLDILYDSMSASINHELTVCHFAYLRSAEPE
jgi:hypothetical protein